MENGFQRSFYYKLFECRVVIFLQKQKDDDFVVIFSIVHNDNYVLNKTRTVALDVLGYAAGLYWLYKHPQSVEKFLTYAKRTNQLDNEIPPYLRP